MCQQEASKCTGLVSLRLHGLGIVTDDTLAHLSALQQLVQLELHCGNLAISDAGLATTVRALPRLRFMHLPTLHTRWGLKVWPSRTYAMYAIAGETAQGPQQPALKHLHQS